MGTMKNVLTRFAVTVAVCLVATTSALAAHFEKLTCSSIPNTKQKSYNVQVTCTATVARPGSAKWYSAAGQHCPNFCTSVGGYNVPSPDGFSCVSGEVRGWSAIGAVNFSPTGCWHDCGRPEGRTGSVSVGNRCYSPGQKRDNDRTDTTLGCFCVTGDTSAKPIELGIHASGSASVSAVSSRLSGWESVDRSVRNDKPGRMFDVIGVIPIGDSATIDMVLNIQGTCGTSVQMSGTIAQPDQNLVRSKQISIPLPACVPQCSDGIDNDGDGAVDYPADGACSSADDNDENDFKTQCQDGVDNDKDGAADYPNDFSCSSLQDNDETNPKSQCQNGIDDDGDGVSDLLDPGCANNQDNNEGDKTTQCQDKIDNDGDGAIDYPNDFSCSSPQDNDEANPKSQCQNGIDDDGDGVTDLLDPGCSSNQDNNEGDKTTQCQDKIDNDGDGSVDYPADAGCQSATDNNEGDYKARCQDGVDNDSDGAIDYPNDFSCSSAQDDDETNPKSQCQNGLDDDGDGVTDLFDPGCADNQDNNEGDKTTQCQDKIDNDGDGAIDYPADAGCQSATDNNEGDFKAACQDGIDNDGDGAMDYPADPGCSSLQDNDEFNQVVLKIAPIAECVDVNQNGTLVAHFGYRNDAASAVDVAIGQRNYFSPGAVDRGQPKTFFTGRVNNVFTVTFPSTDTITWVVGDVTTSANSATERCQGSTLGCVDTDNTSILSSLDGTARLQRRNIRMLGRKVLGIKSTGPSADKAESYRELAKSLYLEQWSDIWGSFPKVSKNCSACAAVDMSFQITDINARAQRMYRLARQTAALLKDVRNGRLRGDEQELVNESSALYDRFVQLSQSLPRFESKCN